MQSVRINLNEEDDEDVRTERYRAKLIEEELNKLRQVCDIYSLIHRFFHIHLLLHSLSHTIETRKYSK